jgi:hypothetical protein
MTKMTKMASRYVAFTVTVLAFAAVAAVSATDNNTNNNTNNTNKNTNNTNKNTKNTTNNNNNQKKKKTPNQKVRGLATDENEDCAGCPLMSEVIRNAPAFAGDVLPVGSGLRFSQKIAFEEGIESFEASVRDTYFPLGPEHFPLDADLCAALGESNCHSIVMPDDFEVKPYTIEALVNHVGGEPFHAPQAEFWPLFEEVILYQKRRLSARDPNTNKSMPAMSPNGMPWLNLPKLWMDLTIDEVAEAVHDEVRYIYLIC